MTTILLTENAGAQLEHVLPNLKTLINDKIVDVRLTSYVEIGSLLNGFSLTNLDKFENTLI